MQCSESKKQMVRQLQSIIINHEKSQTMDMENNVSSDQTDSDGEIGMFVI